MPNINGISLDGLLSTPVVLSALAALVVVFIALAVTRAGVARRLLTTIGVLLIAGASIVIVLDRMTRDEQAAERRALEQRYAELTARVLVPGSMLACLDDGGGETVENACEKLVFGQAQSAASAVAYMDARLTLLADGLAFARKDDPDFARALAGLRRAIELDRFGVAAHVLATRDGCTAERCAAFALLKDANVIKSNLKAQVYDQYVSRYAADWGKTAPANVKEAPQVPVAAVEPAPLPLAEAPAKAPVSDKYDFPSAASIPPVSIMNPEPPLPAQATEARAAQPLGEVPVPPKRPPLPAKPAAAVPAAPAAPVPGGPAAPLPLR